MNGIIVPILTKMAVEDPLKWYKHVATLQRFINSTTSRSTGSSPFELLLKMRNAEDNQLAETLEAEMVSEFKGQREELRIAAKKNIERIQEENREGFNKNRKAAHKYEENDWVAIRKT